MRMRKKPNLSIRMERCAGCWSPTRRPCGGAGGRFPAAREGPAGDWLAARGASPPRQRSRIPDVLYIALERVPDAMIVAMERCQPRA